MVFLGLPGLNQPKFFVLWLIGFVLANFSLVLYLSISKAIHLNKQATSQTPGGAEDQPEKKVTRVQGMLRKSEKQIATARYSVSDFRKLQATCSNVVTMAKLGTKPFGEGKISTKRYHE